MKKVTLFSIIALTCLMSGCNLFQKTALTAKPAPEPQKQDKTDNITDSKLAEKILYGEWTIADVNGQNVTGDNRPYVIFDTIAVSQSTMKYYANNGCNILNGTLTVEPNGKMVPASEGISTMMLCQDAPYEMGINLALATVTHFSIEKIAQDYLLYLKNSDGSTTMTLRKSDLNFINGAWTVKSINGTDIKSDAGVEMVIDIPELKVHGNTGCNILNGSLFIDPDKQNSLQFTNLATTRMACPNAELEQMFLIALEEVETVIPGSNSDKAILKDKSGNTIMELKRLDLSSKTTE